MEDRCLKYMVNGGSVIVVAVKHQYRSPTPYLIMEFKKEPMPTLLK
jgi:hypothetical protein